MFFLHDHRPDTHLGETHDYILISSIIPKKLMYTSSYSSNMGIRAITSLPPFAIVVFLAYLRIASEPLIAGLVCVTFFACLWHGSSMKDCTRISATVYLVSPYYTNLD